MGKKTKGQKKISGTLTIPEGSFVFVDSTFSVQSINIVPCSVVNYEEARENNRRRFFTLLSQEQLIFELGKFRSLSPLIKFFDMSLFLADYGNDLVEANRAINEMANSNNRSFFSELFDLQAGVDEIDFLRNLIKDIYESDAKYSVYILSEIIYNLTLLNISPITLIGVDYITFFLPYQLLLPMMENIRNNYQENVSLTIRSLINTPFFEMMYVLANICPQKIPQIFKTYEIFVGNIICSIKYNIENVNLVSEISGLFSYYEKHQTNRLVAKVVYLEFIDKVFKIFYLAISVGNEKACLELLKKGVWKTIGPISYNAILEVIFFSSPKSSIFTILEYLLVQEDNFKPSYIDNFIETLTTEESRNYVINIYRDFLNDFVDRAIYHEEEFLNEIGNDSFTEYRPISLLLFYFRFSTQEEISLKLAELNTRKILSIPLINIILDLMSKGETAYDNKVKIINYFLPFLNELVTLYHPVKKDDNQIVNLIGKFIDLYNKSKLAKEIVENIVRIVMSSGNLTIEMIAATYIADNSFRSLYFEDVNYLISALNLNKKIANHRNLKEFVIDALNNLALDKRENFVKTHATVMKRFFNIYQVKLEEYEALIQTQERIEEENIVVIEVKNTPVKKIEESIVEESKNEESMENLDFSDFKVVSRKKEKKARQEEFKSVATKPKPKPKPNPEPKPKPKPKPKPEPKPKASQVDSKTPDIAPAESKNEIIFVEEKQEVKPELKPAGVIMPRSQQEGLPDINFFGVEEAASRNEEAEKLKAEIEQLKVENRKLKEEAESKVFKVERVTETNDVYPMVNPNDPSGTVYFYREVIHKEITSSTVSQGEAKNAQKQANNDGKNNLAADNYIVKTISLKSSQNKLIDLKLKDSLKKPKVKDENEEYNNAKKEVEENYNNKLEMIQKKNVTQESSDNYLKIADLSDYPLIFSGVDKADFIYHDQDNFLGIVM